MDTKQKMVAIKYFIANRVGSVKESTLMKLLYAEWKILLKSMTD